jgi:hypothetical protein
LLLSGQSFTLSKSPLNRFNFNRFKVISRKLQRRLTQFNQIENLCKPTMTKPTLFD